MSSTLEFRHLAIALPTSRALAAIRSFIPAAPDFYDWGADGQLYFVFAEAGASNVFECGRSSRVARRWQLAAVGSPYLVLRTVTRTAADYVLGGCVCLTTRTRWTRPETYIAAYRTALERAIPFTEVETTAPSLALRLSLPASRTYQEEWSAREDYRHALRAAGRLTGAEHETLLTAPIGTLEGIADLAWLSTLGQDAGVPAWLAMDYAVNDSLDRLADREKRRRNAARA